MKAENQYDVVILGGGLAGLTLSLQLRKQLPDLRVLVLERRMHPVPEAAFKIGESSVEIGAHYFARVLGLEEHIQRDQLPKLGLRYFFSGEDNSRIEKRVEMGGNKFFPAPSYQFDRGRFENFLGQRAREVGVDFTYGCKVTGVRLSDDDTDHVVETRDECYSTRWLVDASGRTNLLKTQLGLEKSVGHHAHSAWFRINERIKVDDWSDDVSWQQRNHDKSGQRWLSTNHFMGDGYWVWFIPLASGSTSIGIVVDGDMHSFETIDSYKKCMVWLKKHEPQCAAEIEPLEDRLQDFAGFENYSYSAQQVFSEKRWALTGEAGVFLDPFYSPGSDFIAMSNTFLTSLIEQEREGRPYEMYAGFYNEIYLKLFEGNLSLYEKQYPLFGNGTVMPAKVVWDFAYYWSFPAFFFFHERLADLRSFASAEDALNGLRDLNAEMQKSFRAWHAATKGDMPDTAMFFDVTEIPLMYRLNLGLTEPLSEEEFLPRLMANIADLENLAVEIKRLVNVKEPAKVYKALSALV